MSVRAGILGIKRCSAQEESWSSCPLGPLQHAGGSDCSHSHLWGKAHPRHSFPSIHCCLLAVAGARLVYSGQEPELALECFTPFISSPARGLCASGSQNTTAYWAPLYWRDKQYPQT